MKEKKSKVNVVLLGIDTLRADHLSSYGYHRKTSPNIDALARQGVKFDFAISQSPWTFPSFASLFTSLYPSRHGALIPETGKSKMLVDQLVKGEVPPMDESLETFAEIMKKNGFKTAGLAANPLFIRGLNQGFDYFEYKNYKKKIKTEEMVSKSIEWIKANSNSSFFLFLNFMDAHEPTNPPEPFYSMYEAIDGKPHEERHHKWWITGSQNIGKNELEVFKSHKVALYDGAIACLDHQIGRLMEFLKERGLFESTLFIITSDHGEEFYDHRDEALAYYPDPALSHGVAHGYTQFQEQIHVPLIFSGPGIPQGVSYSNTVRSIDVLPTVLDLLGIESTMDYDGISLLPFITGKKKGKDLPAFSEATGFGHEKKSLILGKKKYIWAKKETDLFYDLATDPEEQNNIAKMNEKETQKFKRKTISFWKRIKKGVYKGKSSRQLDEITAENLKALGYLQ